MAEITKIPTDTDGTPIVFDNQTFKKVFQSGASETSWVINSPDVPIEFAVTDNDTAPVVTDAADFTRIVVGPGDGIQTLRAKANARVWARRKKTLRRNSFCYAEVS